MARLSMNTLTIIIFEFLPRFEDSGKHPLEETGSLGSWADES